MSGITGTAAALQQLANTPEARYAPPPQYDYRNNPLGSFEGEAGLQVPYNNVVEARVYVRNWSALLPRRVTLEHVSPQRGGAKACSTKGSPFYGKSPEELRRRVREEGEDCNWYETKVLPVLFALRFNGRQWPIAPDVEEVEVKNEETGEWHKERQPRWIDVPEGAWDLYMGNYQRMRSPDLGERTKELESLSLRGLHKYVLSEENPEGFLEFKRVEIRSAPVVVDRENYSTDQIVEV